MKTKALAIVFLVIVFAVAIVNIPNAAKALNPADKAGTIKEKINEIDAAYNEAFVPKYRFVEINGIAEKALQKQIINDTVILDNGYLSYKFGEKDVSAKGQAVADLRDYLQSKGIEFTYISVPYKNSPYDDEIPYGLYDYGNQNQEAMDEILKANSIDRLDLIQALHEEKGDDWYDAFFVTDHHWKPETGFWAYTEIAQYLSERYGYKLDERSMDFSNYDVDVYKDWFLGSQGKKTGRYVAGLDDVSIIYPKWDTEMSVEIPTAKETREGTFKQAVFDKRSLKKDYYNVSTYTAYLGNMLDLCIQKNESAVNDARLLVVKDSFDISVTPYLSFMFNQVDVIDLRYYEGETLKDYIDRTKPDIVIMPYSSSVFGSKGVFDFGL